MNTHEPYVFGPIARVLIVLLAFVFSLASIIPCSYIPFLKQAVADDSTVSMTKTGNIYYPGGSWNTHKFAIDDGKGVTTGYCVEPSKNSPIEGTYSKLDFVASSGRTAELRADLWFCYGGPGFDESMWPSLNWNNEYMSADDYYLATHILLSDVFSSDLAHATYGADEDFREWVAWNLLGYSTKNTGAYNGDAVGRQIANRVGEVPQKYETFLIGGGSHQFVAAAGYFEPNGNMKMMKHSAMPQISDNNPCYTLSGITYALYTQADCSEQSDTGYRLEVDADGYAEVLDIPAAQYYVREIESSVAGTGYAYDPTVYTCTVEPGETSWLHNTANELGDVDGNDLTDVPQAQEIYVLIQKHDALTQSSVPSGYESMQNAVFTVRYFDNMACDYTVEPTREWVFKTDEAGKIDLADDLESYFVSGDALYKDQKTDTIYFPLGTYTIEERFPCPGYLFATQNGSMVFIIKSSGTGAQDVTSMNVLQDTGAVVTEPPIRHDIQFSKKDADTQSPLGDIPFLIQRMDSENEHVIEEHVAVTNANGIFNSSSSQNLHSYKTNYNDALVSMNPDGSYSVNEDELDPDAGIWFGIAKDGSWIEANDNYGAFPDNSSAKYIITELPVSANEGKQLVQFETYIHASRSSTLQLGTVENIKPVFITVLRDKLDGDKIVSRDYNAQLVDTISYSGLIAGRTYRAEGYLIYADKGLPVRDANGDIVTSEANFTPTSSSGSIDVEFYFDAYDIPNNTRIVACEVIYDGTRELARHDDLMDRGQTVVVVEPTLQTNASDARDADKLLVGDVDATIVDHVEYSGLIPGQQYVLTGTLMDKTTQAPFEFEGQQIIRNVAFEASASSGSLDIEFTFNASGLDAGTELVIFEELSHYDSIITEHKDIEDAAQTVKVVPPSISTYAYDTDNGDKIIATDQSTKIIDDVSYTGLKTQAEYTLHASLINKYTGRPVLDTFGQPVTAEQSFTAQQANGSIRVTFEFDALNNDDGEAVVVFEELYRDGYLLAEHINLNDANQTAILKNPSIRTFASADDNTKILIRDSHSVLKDIVTYQNLVSGNNYVLEGTLYEKASGNAVRTTNGNPVTSSLEFTASSSEGSETLSFEFDASKYNEGDELVVYEKLIRDGVILATHEDLADEAQTIMISQPEIKTSATAQNGTKEIIRDSNAQIIDTVTYKNLVPGYQYELHGTLMDKATASPYVDAQGQVITKSEVFTPDLAEGSFTMNFDFNASNLEPGTELVVFERLYRNGCEIASHEDINDLEQSIAIKSVSIFTKASDAEDGDQIIQAANNIHILDMVIFDGLKPNSEYELVGTLIDKETEEPLLNSQGDAIESRKRFSADKSNGMTELTFDCDTSSMKQGSQIVVFEKLYHDGALIGAHEDITSLSQTITVAAPSISTYAKSASDDEKSIIPNGTATIIDTVEYTGLVPGETYSLEGSLMIDNGTLEGIQARDAFGVPITSHLSFVPDTADGSIDLSFDIDTALYTSETHMVVFETLKYGGVIQATHEDIQSEEQTVIIKETGTKGFSIIDMPLETGTTTPVTHNNVTGAVDTGDKSLVPFAICSALSMLAILGLIWLRFRIVPNEKIRD